MTAKGLRDGPRYYQITFSGAIDDDFIASYCPPGLTIERKGDVVVLSNVLYDQAALIGLIRHLHNLGCLILAVSC